ncbi:MAG: glycosyltransferase family 4 protein [Candidatus Symbiothrix sp.]|jgi:glycosyltransferase involved in cell wall biosynthesis|nr:glycosyltransferase family 4 protein [Candidatus Symbiothrix sp.]
MKIVVTGTRGIPNILGGVETHCEELFPRIAEKGYTIVLIRRTNYIQDQLSIYKNVRLFDLQAPKKKAFEAIIHTLKAVWIAKFKLHADLIHIHAVGPALAIPFARLLGLKVVFTHHGPDYDRDKWGKFAKIALRLGEGFGVKYANEVIVISKSIAHSLQHKYKKYDVNLIHNGVALPTFCTDSDYLKSLNIAPEKYIFAMGRFVPEKNFHHLIHAFASLKNKQNYRLVLAGDADFEDNYSIELKKLAEENDVVLTGFIKGSKLQTLLTHARIFVLPSSHEGLPISLLEALSYRLPVIVSDIPANKEIGLNETAYFQTGNETELAGKLEKSITAPPEKVQYNMEKYRWEVIAEQTAAVYEKIFTAPIPKT